MLETAMLPARQHYSTQAKLQLARSLLKAYPYLPDDFIVATVRRLFGQNRYPMGQQFIEKGMVTLKRALRDSNPRCRDRLVESLFINVGIRGQARRKQVTERLGYEIPLLLVISPTMRCPLNCYGCYAAQYGRDSDLDYNVFDDLIEEAKSLGIYFFVISGGEPFVYPKIYDLFAKHEDAYFQVYTSGVSLNRRGVKRIAELGNILPCVSVEGFEKETDERRGAGHFRKILQGFSNLREMAVPFGFSATATKENNDVLVSDEFIEFYRDQGAYIGYYFQYMPIGREPTLDLVPTPEQRIFRLRRLAVLREKYDLTLADFWNDGPLVGSCLAGGRRYLHVNCAGDIEPCVFCQMSTDNIYEKGLLETLQTSKLFAAIRKRQPYSENYLKPCMIIDNPHILKEVVEEAQPRATCGNGVHRLVTDVYPLLQEYAKEYGPLADSVWKDLYEPAYRETVDEAKQLSRDFEKRHK